MSFLGSPARKAAECGQTIICIPCILCCGGSLMAIFGVMMLVSAVTDTRGQSIEKYNEAVTKWTAEGYPKFTNSTPAMVLHTKRTDGANPREVALPKNLFDGVPTGDAPGNTQDDHIETYKGAYFGPKTESIFSIDTNANLRQFELRVEQTLNGERSDVYKSELQVVKEGKWETVHSVKCDNDDSVYQCERRCEDYCRRNTPGFGECRPDGRECKVRKLLVASAVCLQMDVTDDTWKGTKGCFEKEEMFKWSEAKTAVFSTEVILRHTLDPYIALIRETGNGQFGMTQSEKAAMGTALTVIGVLMIVFVIACVVCLKNTFLDIYRGRKGGAAAAPIMGQQQPYHNQGYVAHQPQPAYQQAAPVYQQAAPVYQQQPPYQQHQQPGYHQPPPQQGYGYRP